MAVTRTVGQLNRASGLMIAGHFEGDVALENKDELGQVVTSFNTIARRLRAEWAQAQEESVRARAAEAMLRKTSGTVQLLQRVAIAANEAATMEEALQTAIEAVCTYTGWSVGHAYSLDGDYAEGLTPTALWYLDDPAPEGAIVGSR